MMLEDVHSAFHEQGDHLDVQDARGADLRRKGRDARVDKRVVKDTRIYMIVRAGTQLNDPCEAMLVEITERLRREFDLSE